MRININKGFVIICLLTLQTEELLAQNVTNSSGLKQGYWEYYPDSIFIPGTMMYLPNSKQNDFIYYRNHCVNSNTNLPDSFMVKANFVNGLLHGKYEVYDDTFLVFSGLFNDGQAHGTFFKYGYFFIEAIYKCSSYVYSESRYYHGKLDGPLISRVMHWSGILKAVETDVVKIEFYEAGSLSHSVYIEETGKVGYKWIRKRLWNKWYRTRNKTVGKKK